MQIYQLEPQIIVPHKWNSHSEKSNLNCKLKKATNEAESLGYLNTHSVSDNAVRIVSDIHLKCCNEKKAVFPPY